VFEVLQWSHPPKIRSGSCCLRMIFGHILDKA